jgi:hypothetical protein
MIHPQMTQMSTDNDESTLIAVAVIICAHLRHLRMII